jgi:hypothetical protein
MASLSIAQDVEDDETQCVIDRFRDNPTARFIAEWAGHDGLLEWVCNVAIPQPEGIAGELVGLALGRVDFHRVCAALRA